jgi:predicted ATPase
MAGRRNRREKNPVFAGMAPFVERESELAALRELLRNADAGRGGFAVITGEAGIGKTRLIDHFVAEFGRRSAIALWGRCHPDPDIPAYWPWKQIIARYAEHRNDSELQRDLGAATRDIVPLSPELALRFRSSAPRA